MAQEKNEIKNQTQKHQKALYWDVTLPIEERLADLVSRMTLEEKISQMKFNAPAIERLGISDYNWWNECLHGVARAGIATVFPQAIGLAATWNPDLLSEIATVISDEARAKHHEAFRRNDRGIYKGLTFWSPNINIFRDPRWGRGQETYGEDPYLTARMGVAFVKGLQGDDPKYLKVVATPKHYAVHSGPEPDRHHFDAQTDERDLRETYLPAFKACVVEGKAFSVMGAYNRYNGEACCASEKLLQKILRDEWGFDGYVVSDCGAIKDIYAHHKIVETAPAAIALAVKASCDLNCGEQHHYLLEAVKKRLISEEEIDQSVSRLFKARFRLGMFDPPEMVPYAQIPYDVIDSEKHDKLALKAAQQSIVLLKNENNFLPLKNNLKSIAVIGPNADVVDVLLGNYNGMPSNPITALASIRQKVSPQTEVHYVAGCNITDSSPLLKPIPSSALKPLNVEHEQLGLRGQYFDNPNFEDEARFVRIDHTIDFDWHGESPAPGIGKDHFSIRWTGKLVPPVSGDYTLGIEGDDCYRLYIDDQLTIENWREHSTETRKAPVTLQAGQEVAMRLDYSEIRGQAVIRLLWGLPNEAAFQNAVDLAAESEVAIMVGGISPKLEGEEMETQAEGFKGGDRVDINLPKIQQKLLEAIHATGTPTVLVLMSGSALALNWANEHIPAIIQAWYPGQQGGTAIADVLFGDYNPAGRLPVTFYKSVDQLPPFEDYNMAGRTYRYFQGEPLYPFGYGLSYTTFKYDNLRISPKEINPNDSATVQVDVQNIGKVAGDEVVQLYLTNKESHVPVPIKSLKAFQRFHLNPGEVKTVMFQLNPADFSLIDENYIRSIEPGDFEIMLGGHSQTGLKAALTVIK